MSRKITTLTRYTYFPKELFHPQIGHTLNLRPVQASLFPAEAELDLAHQQRERLRRAKVEVEGLKEGYVPPKGCPLKPNSNYMQYWMHNKFHTPLSRVWIIQEGTPLPPNLVLIQQGDTQQWSIDPVGKQTLTELNDNINSFFRESAAIVTAAQWRRAFPRATEVVRKIIDPKGERRPKTEVVEMLEAKDKAPEVKFGVRFR